MTGYQLDGANVTCLFALRASAALERNALVFRQRLEAVALDVLKVREQVAATAIRCDESKALGIVEPFYSAGLIAHDISFIQLTLWD